MVDSFLEARRLLREAPSRIGLGGVEVIDASWIWPELPLDSWRSKVELMVELGLKVKAARGRAA
jgi:hypothetical protein